MRDESTRDGSASVTRLNVKRIVMRFAACVPSVVLAGLAALLARG